MSGSNYPIQQVRNGVHTPLRRPPRVEIRRVHSKVSAPGPDGSALSQPETWGCECNESQWQEGGQTPEFLTKTAGSRIDRSSVPVVENEQKAKTLIPRSLAGARMSTPSFGAKCRYFLEKAL
ncbi:hypothetical protein B0H14DRAFT_2632775 [Mycena olivaceomarginata]|nr:hypothetical protein B0H14DRAFT_2632775 [Mycena olivaceomarginata]